MTVHIVQDGNDGFGHQLEGLFTCLILHNVNYYFDGISYIEKKFCFEHVNNNESQILKEYLIESVNEFIKEYKLSKIIYKNTIRSHELWKIPFDYENNILYSLDNVFFYKKLLKKCDVEKIIENTNLMKKYFINSKLPQNRLNKENIVIHIRLGDALTSGRSESIFLYNESIMKLIDIFKKKYPNNKYYIHSDGYPLHIIEKIGSECFFYGKEDCSVMETLSDFIHANILICGNSSLSKVCSYFGNKELIIVNDDNDHSIPDTNTYNISTYLEMNKS